MRFTYALAIGAVAALFGAHLEVSASPRTHNGLQTRAQNEDTADCAKLFAKRNVLSKSGPGLRARGPRPSHRPGPGPRELEASLTFAEDTLSRMARLEANLAGAGVTVGPGTPAHSQLIASYPAEQALDEGRDALVVVKASLFLAHSHCRRFGLNEDRCAKYISTFNLNTTSLAKKCSPLPSSQLCPKSSRYRSLDGSCNHQLSSRAGAAFSGYRRLLAAEYGDALQLPREDAKGRALPSARLIAARLLADQRPDDPDDPANGRSERGTPALLQWTQFVEHDMTHTPTSRMSGASRSSIMCCSADGGVLQPRHVHPSCLPVPVPHDDPVFSKERVRCLNYVRSVPAIRGDCSFGPLEQMNQATHFLDGSMIYGTTSEKALSLRQFERGKLIDSSKGGRRFLPNAEKPTEECLVNSDATTCFKSGDVRVNSQPHVTLLYTVWHREHNRLARALSALNPHWPDETLYQEARRIVGALVQHITFAEWLPALLGEKFTRKQGLRFPMTGSSHLFDEHVDPSVSNSFSAAAVRFVHSLPTPTRRPDADALSSVGVGVSGVDGLIRELVAQNVTERDAHAGQDGSQWRPAGLLVPSMDIQRGRDHGLPGYNKYRRVCGLPQAASFEQFQDVIPKAKVEKLRSLYGHPNDVDLLVGGMAEQPSAGSLLGPTLSCILAEQFERTLKGDRFFYDLQNQPHSFTPAQLRSLKKVTLARILCDNGDDIVSMQPDVFSRPQPSNELVPCAEEARIPRLDLDLWRTAQDYSSS